MNPSLKNLINSCFLVTYKVSPVPRNLSDSLLIYRGLSEIGNIVQYRLALCPVTKKRTDKLRVVFHDIEPAPSRDLDLDLVVNGRSNYKDGELSKMEARVVEVDAIEGNTSSGPQKFTLKPQLVSRDKEKITKARDLANAKYFHTSPSSKAVENAKSSILKGFTGLFERA